MSILGCTRCYGKRQLPLRVPSTCAYSGGRGRPVQQDERVIQCLRAWRLAGQPETDVTTRAVAPQRLLSFAGCCRAHAVGYLAVIGLCST